MFGVLRTILAFMVMMFHLFAHATPLGRYPVFGFYIISGYLMTRVMHETYGFGLSGRIAFLVNRFIRLYPQYWAAAVVTLCLIFWQGNESLKSFHPSIYTPESPQDIAFNLSMVFPSWRPNTVNPRLVPPAWALTIELFFYCLICAGASQTLKRTAAWMGISIIYVIWSFMSGLASDSRYFPLAAASLPFSFGSLIYFASISRQLYVRNITTTVRSWHLFTALMLNCALWIILSAMRIGAVEELGVYINVVLCGLLVLRISSGDELLRISRKADHLIGSLSYPVYLLHYQCGFVASLFLFKHAFHEFSVRGFASLAVAVLLVLLLSSVFILSIDVPLQYIRVRIKAKVASVPDRTPEKAGVG